MNHCYVFFLNTFPLQFKIFFGFKTFGKHKYTGSVTVQPMHNKKLFF